MAVDTLGGMMKVSELPEFVRSMCVAGASQFEIEINGDSVTRVVVRCDSERLSLAKARESVRSIPEQMKATDQETKANPKKQFDGLDLDVLTRSAT